MSAQRAESSPWIRRFFPAPDARTRLVCLPHAGGSAPYFLSVARALAPGVDVLAVQYPGRQDRRTEPGIDDIGALADHVARALAAWSDKPLTIFGHSMGATIGFELARRLPPDVPLLGLVASGRSAPSCVRAEQVHRYDDAKLLDEIRAMSGTDAQVFDDDEIVRMIMPALRVDYRAVETYRCEPGVRIGVPITVLTGDADPRTSLEQARAWEGHTDGEFDLQVFPGGHFYLNDQPAAVLAAITDRIARWSRACVG